MLKLYTLSYNWNLLTNRKPVMKVVYWMQAVVFHVLMSDWDEDAKDVYVPGNHDFELPESPYVPGKYV